jgi:hypothetical protein
MERVQKILDRKAELDGERRSLDNLARVVSNGVHAENLLSNDSTTSLKTPPLPLTIARGTARRR